jgi:putative DNA primase/helicase
MSTYSAVPSALKDRANWITWRYEPRDGKETKIPYDAKTGRKAKANDSSTWASFQVAIKAADILSGNDIAYEGIGFELGGTSIVGIDFDNARDEKGVIDPYVLDILRVLDNPYTEISPSGKGLHAFVECDALPPGGRKLSKGHDGIEIYHGREGGRYFTISTNRVLGDGVPHVDDISLAYLLITQNRDKKFQALWLGDTSAYDGDDSSADLALMTRLARLTQSDPAKMEKFFSASKLGQRKKWIDRADYRKRTIDKAIGGKDEPSSTKPSPTATEDAKLNLVPLSDVQEEVQRWLWDGRIPLAALTNLSGDADRGKSLVLYDICARISNGSDFPDGAKNPFQGEPKKVLLLFSEGSLKTTVKPRMTVMGAHMANIFAVKSVSRSGETDPDKRQFYLDQDLGRLRQVLRENPDIMLIAFDPLTNYLGDDCNLNLSKDVRKVLTPLSEMAEEFGITVIAIIHFSKNDMASAIHRTGGAAALVEVPRAAWCCVKDDDPEHKGDFIFVRLKNNLGKRVGGIRYRIEETFIPIKGEQASQPRLVWGAATDKTADALLKPPQNTDENDAGIAKAKHWLEDIFQDNFARRSAAVHQLAEADGITEDCLKKARLKMQMQTKKINDRWLMRRHQSKDLPWAVSTDIQQRLDGMETQIRDPTQVEPVTTQIVVQCANSADEEIF